MWIVIDNNVYDLTKFQEIHPGGKKILARVAGSDASKQFHKYHEVDKVMKKYGIKFRIGKLTANETAAIVPNEASSALVPAPTSAPVAGAHLTAVRHEPFGDMVPYGDPAWYQGNFTPYYNESHVRLRAEIREFVDEYIEPYVDDWDAAGVIEDDIAFKEFAKRGYLACLVGVKSLPKELLEGLGPKSVKLDEIDAFHELVIVDELSRCGSGGVVWNLVGGYSIGAPPVFKFARPEIQRRVVPEIVSGRKRICLCITEPDAGSDVANLTTTAEKTPDGKHYIVNGTKKWITNGVWSDYFSVAVRTGGKGMNGISMLLIEKTFPGVSVRKMETQGMRVSGSTYITFEDVKVPVENLIGKENKGFAVIMSNFNHERLGVILQANRMSRVLYETACKYAHQRETFGKKLIQHDVIRNKLAQMACRIEAVHNWLEQLMYEFQLMDEREVGLRLGGPIAGCKAMATQTMELCAREASQIFGGLAYTRGGKAAKVERLYREVRAYAIPGGSEEIMLDLSMRQALRVHKALGAKL